MCTDIGSDVGVQVDPMKPKLKPPGTERLKLKCDDPLSIFAFNFNLRRYLKEYRKHRQMRENILMVGRCRLTAG